MSEERELLTLLLEERAILRTLHRYCHAMDYGLEQEWVDTFTPDGVFDVFRPGGDTIHREEGRDDLAAYVARYPKPPDSFHKHIVIDPIIDIDGDVATVRSYFLALRDGEDGTPHLFTFGRYHDRLRKLDGVWRIEERLAEVEAS